MTVPQHMQALERANEHRLARSTLKHRIADREDHEVTVVSVLQGVPEYAQTMLVSDLLSAQFYWGRDRSRRLLAVAQVREGKKLGELTERQRNVICDLLNWGVA